MRTGAILAVAVLAGALGVVASLATGGAGPLWRSEVGQHVLQNALDASADPPPQGVEIAEQGQIVPTVAVQDLTGTTTTLPARENERPVLVNFWASWCAPCIEEMPELQRFAASQGDSGVQVIGIALDDRDAVLRFLDKVPVQYPVYLDAPGAADSSVRWGNRKGVLPYTILLDGHGRLRRRHVGPFSAGQVDAWAEAGLQQR